MSRRWFRNRPWRHRRRKPEEMSVQRELGQMPAATLVTALMVTVAGMSIRMARRRIPHERWHGLHLLMYLAVALGFAHQLAGPDFVGHRWLQVLWALSYTYVFALVLRYRVLAP